MEYYNIYFTIYLIYQNNRKVIVLHYTWYNNSLSVFVLFCHILTDYNSAGQTRAGWQC